MIDLTGVTEPKFGDKASGLAFVTELLARYEKELNTYTGKAETKSGTKVSAVLEKVQEDDSEAVKIADEILNHLRHSILLAMEENPNVAVVLYPGIDDIKKVVGSWRDEANITVEDDDSDSEEDRDLVSEYEALRQCKETIEGAVNVWQIAPTDLPEKYRANRKEKDGTTGKQVAIPNEYVLKIPGKLTAPNSEGKTAPGREPTSYSWKWTLDLGNGETLAFKGVTLTTLARMCSTEHSLMSFADLKTALDNRNWLAKDITRVEVNTVPRGTLIGERVSK